MHLLREIGRDRMLWLVAFVPASPLAAHLSLGAHTLVLFVAPVLVLLSYVIGPAPMDLRFWPGAVVMALIATLAAAFVTDSGRSAWFVGALLLLLYAVFAMTLNLLPPQGA